MTGRPVQEDDSVPVPATAQQPSRRNRRVVQRRTAAAMMGMAETQEDDAIIPDDAEEIENIMGSSGVRLDKEPEEIDQQADEPDHPSATSGTEPLLSPKDALVAPDVTPQALEPIDPSEVPAPKHAPQAHSPPRFVPPNREVNPMDVLLGRRSPQAGPQAPAQPEADNVVTAESAQAAVNASLNVGGMNGEALLRPREPMPDPTPGNASKIMEAFSKYGPKPTWNF